jgi:hypothetical protein
LPLELVSNVCHVFESGAAGGFGELLR